jgi:hypothetical protein
VEIHASSGRHRPVTGCDLLADRRLHVHNTISRSLGGDAVNDIIRACAIRAGVLRAEDYTAHSLRGGGAIVAYAAGHPHKHGP